MRTDDGDHEYEENVRGRGRKKRLRSILETVVTGGNVGQGHPDCTRIRKHSKARELPMHQRLPVQGRKGWRVQKARMDDCRE